MNKFCRFICCVFCMAIACCATSNVITANAAPANTITTTISKVESKAKGFKVTWKKKSKVKGYQIQYSTSSKFKKSGSKTKTITKSTTNSANVSKLKGCNKKYYVRVRTYKVVKDKKVYSSWSKAKSVTTLKHKYSAATCTKAKICKYCESTSGKALGHKWKSATCTKAKTCSRCDKTSGEALGHSWNEATCVAPKTCKKCGETEGLTSSHTCIAGVCSICGHIPEVSVEKIWMEEPGKTVTTGDTITFYVEAYFKYKPNSFVLWFKSCDNSSSKKSAVTSVSETAEDNIYSVTLTITDDMFPGKWTGDWYYISDKYNTYKQSSFSEDICPDIWFNISE